MKTFTKVVLILSSIFIFVGLIAIIVSVALGASFDGKGAYKTYDFTNTYTNIKSINIDMNVGKVVVKEGTEFKIEATGVIKDRFESSVKDNVWTIKEFGMEKDFWYTFFWHIERAFSFREYSPKVTVYIPSNTTLDSFDINVGAGTGAVDNLITKSLKADVGAGNLTINNINSSRSDVSAGVGSISINGVMLGYNKINCGVGNIKLYLKGKETDYNYTYSVGVGNITINDSRQSGTSNSKIDNKAINDFYISCGVGNVDIGVKE